MAFVISAIRKYLHGWKYVYVNLTITTFKGDGGGN